MAQISYVTSIASSGRIVIPAAVRKALGIRPGDRVILQLSEGELRLLPRAEALRRLQERVRRTAPKGVSLSEELIRERREEAKGE